MWVILIVAAVLAGWVLWTIGAVNVLLFGLAGVAFVAFFFASMFILLKRSDVYRLARQRATEDPRLPALLGTPLCFGHPQGSIETAGDEGRATLQFSVHGPSQKGTLFAVGVKDAVGWSVVRLEFAAAGDAQRLLLLNEVHGIQAQASAPPSA